MMDNFTVGDGSLSKEKWVKEFLSVLKNFTRLHVLIFCALKARTKKDETTPKRLNSTVAVVLVVGI